MPGELIQVFAKTTILSISVHLTNNRYNYFLSPCFWLGFAFLPGLQYFWQNQVSSHIWSCLYIVCIVVFIIVFIFLFAPPFCQNCHNTFRQNKDKAWDKSETMSLIFCQVGRSPTGIFRAWSTVGLM